MSDWVKGCEEAFGLLQAGLLQKAITTFMALLTTAPTMAAEAVVLGTIGGIHLYHLNDSAAAEPFYKSGTESAPGSELISLGLFHSLWDQGKKVEAYDEMERLLALRPSEEYSRLLSELEHDSPN